MNLVRRATEGVKFNSLKSVVILISGFIKLYFFSKYLQPSDFGLIAITLLLIDLAKILIETSMKEVVISTKKLTDEKCSSLYFYCIFLSIVATIIILCLSNILENIFQISELGISLRLMSISIFLAGITIYFQSLFLRNLKFRIVAISYILSVIIGLASSLIFLYFEKTVFSWFLGSLLSNFTLAIFTLFVALKSRIFPEIKFKYSVIKDEIKFGIYRSAAAILNNIQTKSHELIIAFSLGPSVVGLYSVIKQLIIQPFKKINPILKNVSLPLFSKVSADNNLLERGYLLSVKLIAFLLAPTLTCIYTILPDIIPIYLGEAWLEIILPAQIVCLYIFFNMLGLTTISLVISKGEYVLPFRLNAIMVVFAPLLTLIISLTSGELKDIFYGLVIIQIINFYVAQKVFVTKVLGNIFIKLISKIVKPIFFSLLLLIYFLLFDLYIVDLNIYLLMAAKILTGLVIYIALSLIFDHKFLLKVYNLALQR